MSAIRGAFPGAMTSSHVASLPPYVYSNLPEGSNTRLLKLSPSLVGSASLICTLAPVNLNLSQGYEAVSYTWGAPSFTEPLIVDGCVKYITPNLRDALFHFRNSLEFRYLGSMPSASIKTIILRNSDSCHLCFKFIDVPLLCWFG